MREICAKTLNKTNSEMLLLSRTVKAQKSYSDTN